MNDFAVVFVTAKNSEEAEKIAKALVENGAAACVNIVPDVLSIYSWKGSVEREQETLMIIKSRVDSLERTMELVESMHSYEVPEIISVPLAYVSKKYRDYLESFFGNSSR